MLGPYRLPNRVVLRNRRTRSWSTRVASSTSRKESLEVLEEAIERKGRGEIDRVVVATAGPASPGQAARVGTWDARWWRLRPRPDPRRGRRRTTDPRGPRAGRAEVLIAGNAASLGRPRDGQPDGRRRRRTGHRLFRGRRLEFRLTPRRKAIPGRRGVQPEVRSAPSPRSAASCVRSRSTRSSRRRRAARRRLRRTQPDRQDAGELGHGHRRRAGSPMLEAIGICHGEPLEPACLPRGYRRGDPRDPGPSANRRLRRHAAQRQRRVLEAMRQHVTAGAARPVSSCGGDPGDGPPFITGSPARPRPTTRRCSSS